MWFQHTWSLGCILLVKDLFSQDYVLVTNIEAFRLVLEIKSGVTSCQRPLSLQLRSDQREHRPPSKGMTPFVLWTCDVYSVTSFQMALTIAANSSDLKMPLSLYKMLPWAISLPLHNILMGWYFVFTVCFLPFYICGHLSSSWMICPQLLVDGEARGLGQVIGLKNAQCVIIVPRVHNCLLGGGEAIWAIKK